MVLNSGTLNQLGAPTALAEDPEDPNLGPRSLPHTPEISWASDEEEYTSVLDIVEEEAPPAIQLRPEDKVFGEEGRNNASSTGGKLHVDDASHILMKLRHILL